jgi:D-lyxose ketol-isomerase
MLSKSEFLAAQQRANEAFREAGIIITPEEAERIEVADFGLNDLEHVGLELLTYVNTDRVCAKELVLFPHQFCPEHYHPPVAGEPGKEETFRCRKGEVYLYVPGEPKPNPKAKPPAGSEPYVTVRHEIILRPGEQHTLPPGTRHWFVAGPEGAIISEFSTTSRDETDVFTDPRIERLPRVAEE